MSDEGGYELEMPFVTVVSRGGVHDDVSYVAGYEAGLFDAKLARGPVPYLTTVHSANLPQLDLIAMKHGYALDRDEDYNEWTVVNVRLAANA